MLHLVLLSVCVLAIEFLVGLYVYERDYAVHTKPPDNYVSTRGYYILGAQRTKADDVNTQEKHVTIFKK